MLKEQKHTSQSSPGMTMVSLLAERHDPKWWRARAGGGYGPLHAKRNLPAWTQYQTICQWTRTHADQGVHAAPQCTALMQVARANGDRAWGTSARVRVDAVTAYQSQPVRKQYQSRAGTWTRTPKASWPDATLQPTKSSPFSAAQPTSRQLVQQGESLRRVMQATPHKQSPRCNSLCATI